MNSEPDFFQQVYNVVRQIPVGRVTSYGAIAKYLGSPGAARMVGWAMNNSHKQTDYVPAHRVVNRNGALSGKHHFSGEKVMQELLQSEGIKVEYNTIINFDEIFWSPCVELI